MPLTRNTGVSHRSRTVLIASVLLAIVTSISYTLACKGDSKEYSNYTVDNFNFHFTFDYPNYYGLEESPDGSTLRIVLTYPQNAFFANTLSSISITSHFPTGGLWSPDPKQLLEKDIDLEKRIPGYLYISRDTTLLGPIPAERIQYFNYPITPGLITAKELHRFIVIYSVWQDTAYVIKWHAKLDYADKYSSDIDDILKRFKIMKVLR